MDALFLLLIDWDRRRNPVSEQGHLHGSTTDVLKQNFCAGFFFSRSVVNLRKIEKVMRQ